MSDLKLVKATNISAIKIMQFRQAFLSVGERSINGSRGLHNYEKYEEWLWLVKECEKPANSLLGVQASTYFAVRKSDDVVVGCIELRHTLNASLSVIGGHIGFGVKVLLTCDIDNIGSYKTVEACGGKKEQEAPFVLDGELYYKYWIVL